MNLVPVSHAGGCHVRGDAVPARFERMDGTDPARRQTETKFEVPHAFAAHGGNAFCDQTLRPKRDIEAQLRVMAT
jgi:hypothetical protein